MRKMISLAAVVVLGFIALCPFAVAESVYSVLIKINFEGNLLFSTYNVAMYLNDTELAVLSHGEDFSGSFNMKEGKYTISLPCMKKFWVSDLSPEKVGKKAGVRDGHRPEWGKDEGDIYFYHLRREGGNVAAWRERRPLAPFKVILI